MIRSRKRTISEADDGLATGGRGALLDGSTGLRRRRVGDDREGSGRQPALSKAVSMEMPPTAQQPPRQQQRPQPPTPSAIAAPVAVPPSHQQERKAQQQPQQQQQSVVPLSMQLMRPFWTMAHCPDCDRPATNVTSFGGSFNEDFFAGTHGYTASRSSNVDAPCPRNVSVASLNGGAREAEAAGRDQPDESTGNDGAMRSRRGTSYSNISPSSFQSSESSLSSADGPSQQTSSNGGEAEYNPNVLPATPATTTLAAYSNEASIEQILHEYTAACQIFGCASRINPGVLTTFRFALPTLRVSGNFFDADLLALTEVLLRHCNGALRYIKRLDFTIAAKEGKYVGVGKKGIRSHGAYALSKVLAASKYIEEVYLCRNRIGPYGSAAIFAAAAENAKAGGTLTTLRMRGCRVGERGARAFAREVCATKGEEVKGGLEEVDLSACRMGFAGCYAIEAALKERTESGERVVNVDLEGNMVFQEVMNCVTHGLGIVLGTVGTYLLTRRVSGQPFHYVLSCAIYSASLILLYTSSTLYHSFFALRRTKFIFKVLDNCAIYLLIAGSYTPFLMIALHHEPKWSLHLLLFIWACAISGVLVTALCHTWEHKSKFSLAMYLGMGWSCLVCMNDLVEVLPASALALMVAGGVSYTGGVPFFVRNNNLDHSIWHLFVLAGSVFHWLCVYWYVAKPVE